MSKTKIQIIYKTEKGTELPSYEAALIADAIEKIESIYLESYKIKDIANALDASFHITSRIKPEEETEEKGEAGETL